MAWPHITSVLSHLEIRDGPHCGDCVSYLVIGPSVVDVSVSPGFYLMGVDWLCRCSCKGDCRARVLVRGQDRVGVSTIHKDAIPSEARASVIAQVTLRNQ